MKKILFNPFEKYNDRALLVIGLLITLFSSIIGYCFNARFDGTLHIGFEADVTYVEPLTDNIFNVACLFFAFSVFGYLINKKTRPIDILNTVMIARFPFCLGAISNINGIMYKTSQIAMKEGTAGLMANPDDLILMTIMSFLVLPLLVWYIVLLYNGFKTAVNIKTTRHKILFAVALIVSHIISSILFSIIY